jgi:hypothetical protein
MKCISEKRKMNTDVEGKTISRRKSKKSRTSFMMGLHESNTG